MDKYTNDSFKKSKSDIEKGLYITLGSMTDLNLSIIIQLMYHYDLDFFFLKKVCDNLSKRQRPSTSLADNCLLS